MSLVTADCAWMKSKSEVTFLMLSGETLSRSRLLGSLPLTGGRFLQAQLRKMMLRGCVNSGAATTRRAPSVPTSTP